MQRQLFEKNDEDCGGESRSDTAAISARTTRRRWPARNPIVKLRLTRLPKLDGRCLLINMFLG